MCGRLCFVILSICYLFGPSTGATTPAGPSAEPVTCNSSLAHQLFIKDLGLYWCQGSGLSLPLACMAPDSSRVDFGSSFWTHTVILVCTLSENGVLGWVQDACLVKGQRVNVTESLRYEFYVYKCVRSNDGSLKLNVTGCVWANETHVSLGSTINIEDNTYTCDAADAIARLGVDANRSTSDSAGETHEGPATKPPSQGSGQGSPDAWTNKVGCKYNGVQWKVGEEKVELGNVWYKCTEDSPNPVIYGCYVNGTKYKIEETFYNNHTLLAFRCQKLNGPFPVATPYACLEQYLNGSIVKYEPGRVWLSENGGYNDQYVMTCVKHGLMVERRSIGCYYKTNEGAGVLDDSCMKSVGPLTIQCWPLVRGVTSNNRIKITNNPPTDADTKRFKKGGLKYCDSKTLSSVVN